MGDGFSLAFLEGRTKGEEREWLDWFWESIDEEYALGPSSFIRNCVVQSSENGQSDSLDDMIREWKEEEGKWDLKERKKHLNSLSFDPYSFPIQGKFPHHLMILSFDMFNVLGLIDSLHIDEIRFKRTLLVIRDSYRNIPFHNFYHSFNVAQSIFYLLHTKNLKVNFTHVELFSLLLSSLCHDVDHPGLNNTFLQNAKTQLGLKYGRKKTEGKGETGGGKEVDSVLEQHHCQKTFEILNRKDCNFFSQMKDEDVQSIKEIVSRCILSTDLSLHGDFMEKLKKLENVDWNNSEHKQWIMCSLIKCADISNEIRPSSIGKKWAQRVMTEFYAQSSLEKEKGLPVAPHMDPMKTNTATGQIGFITYLCLPFFNELTRLFPAMKICCDQMIENRKEWEKVNKGETA